MHNPSNFPLALRRCRLGAGYSQAALAERTGIQPAVISFYETGRRYPTLPALCLLANALGVELDALVAAR
jgi:transcriptional regulator with XRE-family HTH domain